MSKFEISDFLLRGSVVVFVGYSFFVSVLIAIISWKSSRSTSVASCKDFFRSVDQFSDVHMTRLLPLVQTSMSLGSMLIFQQCN